ncbi:alpha-mannosidase [Devosia nitrariae]|uniref:Alpha-mannosidase n=1 Tax=Devosia nitrariae TaxID=2071872 RepID=A0ABQ5W8E8_9HYPH|nr:glycoside hydrolase family 38 C-terminal domain-containing protein [Devosia nitrariae]GLQ56247.1 alpha-mannosidase [Devosia nitrariae]
MSFVNPLAQRLGLLTDDTKQEGKLARLCDDLARKILTPVPGEVAWRYNEDVENAGEALGADWRGWPEFTQRTVWSKKQGHTWFAAEIEVPAEAAGKTFVLRFTSQWQNRPGSTDPQCLAYLDGHIAQALDGNHNELVIARDAKAGEKHTLLVNAFTFFDRPLAGFHVEYLVRNEQVEQLYYDLVTPFQVATYLPQTDARRHAILNLVDRALRALDRRGAVTPELEASLSEAEKIAAEIYKLTDTEVQPVITAVGHTHLDVGWLWRVMHTRDKTGRSFATVLNLMSEYPGFVFMYNQSVLFNFIKTDYPEIWEGLKKKVKSGQFEIEGAMWVEPDVNIVSGESLVRQIMRGRRFHIEEFGVTPKCVWLPDTFGYSANLPQIMEKSGLDYFVTSKLSWNDTDRHPYDTFFWRGIDGTVTKAQLITAQRMESDAIFTTYNSDLSVSEVMGAWKRYEPKAVSDEVLVCYGYGDGGGGPTRAMIERGLRLERGIPGAPKVRMEGLVPFLDRLGERMEENANRFPTWNGELYLQYHRGTLTSVAKNKANNRKAERRLRELEFLSSMAFSQAGLAYPAEKLNEFWELVLINQFHDILPGTSIPEVYADSDAEYGMLFSTLDSANGPWVTAARAASKPAAGELRLLNFTSQDCSGELAALEGPGLEGKALAQAGKTAPLQKLVGAAGETRYAAPVATLPALGWAGAGLSAGGAAPATNLSVSKTHLENALIRVGFDDKGEITSIVDKASGRELIENGKTANRLVAYEDKSMNWDAWDIDWYFEEQSWPLADGQTKIEVVEEGPYRAAIRVERSYQKSRFVQVISLVDGVRQVEFDTYIDWHERQTVVKTLFPFDMNVSEIRSEIQFGHVKRATHRNTSWDRARFEASMHRWVDLSEPDFGAALLNDCKYAYDAVEQLVRLTLVRGSTHPSPDADIGEHRLRYALFVHEGLSDLHEVHRAAERFNNPVAVLGDVAGAGQGADATFSFASVDVPTVTIETVKKAEKSDALVLRVFEHANRRANPTIRFGMPVKSARLVNLMEEGGTPLEVEDNTVRLALRPFEIATVMVELA